MRIASAFLCLAIVSSLLSPARAQDQEWQQRVRYDMEIQLDAESHRMEGVQRLTYFNNSPDTLRQVFYHLYYNAFQPNSMMAERNRLLPDPDPRVVPRIWELGPDEIGYHRVQTLRQDGRDAAFKVNDTVMQVALARPIAPGDSTRFEMAFESQVPLMTRRGGRDSPEGIDFSMAQWYPKMAAYDARGWHADPYIGREFYAPYGTFDVRITLPARYVLGGTGTVQNAEEVGHGYEAVPQERPARAPSERLTWHFRAQNVHDFAWVADPDYVHDRFTDAYGYVYHALYQPNVAERWRSHQQQLPKVIEFLSRNYGRYPYPQLTIAQGGDGGMEYPMVTFLTGDRGIGTVVHEVAHMWYYAGLGSNETKYAWMDEGFANFISGEALAHIGASPRADHSAPARGIASALHYGYFEPLNTPSDWFRTNAAYGTAAYSGGEMILALLGMVISEPLRDQFLREYYRRFLFRHPQPEDVERVAEEVSGLQLDWFFEQMLRTEIDVDYTVERVSMLPGTGGGQAAEVTLKRRGGTVLPVDLLLVLEDSAYAVVHVPISESQGHKPIPSGWRVADPWPWLDTEYTFTVPVPGRVVNAVVDPAFLTPDMDRLNNTSRIPIRSAFLRTPTPDWSTYGVGYRPLGQYADGYGVGIGAQVRGAYVFGKREARAMVKLWPGTLAREQDGHWSDLLDYEVSYSDVLPGNEARFRAGISSQKHFGFIESALSLSALLGRNPWLRSSTRRAELMLLHQYGTMPTFYTQKWMWDLHSQHSASILARVSAGDSHNRVALLGEFGSTLRSYVGRGSAGTRVVVNALRSIERKGLRFNARTQIALGAGSLLPGKQHRLGGVNTEEAWRNDAFRTLSSIRDEHSANSQFLALSLVGPVAYGDLLGFRDNHLIAGSLEITSGPLSRQAWIVPLRMNAFSGAGKQWSGYLSGVADRPLLADAGIGASYDVSALRPLARWTAQSDVLSTLRLAARFPLWVGHPSLRGERDQFAFRWVLGIETEF